MATKKATKAAKAAKTTERVYAADFVKMMDQLIPETDSIIGELFSGRTPPTHYGVPPRKDLVVVQIDIKDMYKRVTDFMFDKLQNTTEYIGPDTLLDLITPFGGPIKMRATLRDPFKAAILLGDEYTRVAEMMDNEDPFVIVIKNGDAVWTAVTPFEDIH